MRRIVLGCAATICLATLPAIASATTAPGTTSTPACGPLLTLPHHTGAVPSPRPVLGFDLGAREATDREIGTYWDAVDRASNRVLTGTFAHSWQDRPLRYALVGTPRTLGRLGCRRCSTRTATSRSPTSTT